MDIYLVKQGGAFFPADKESEEGLKKFKQGEPVKAKVTRPRNYDFHKKFFAMLSYAYDHFEPVVTPESEHGIEGFGDVELELTFDDFRGDILILAGYRRKKVSVTGCVTYQPKSIKFSNMSQDEFEKVYSACVNVILKHILKNYTREDFDKVIDEFMRF